MADQDVPTRTNPSTESYERARKVVLGWLKTLHRSVVIPEDDGGQLIDSLAWEIDAAVIAAQLRLGELIKALLIEAALSTTT